VTFQNPDQKRPRMESCESDESNSSNNYNESESLSSLSLSGQNSVVYLPFTLDFYDYIFGSRACAFLIRKCNGSWQIEIK
jgi:hypothetical protein